MVPSSPCSSTLLNCVHSDVTKSLEAIEVCIQAGLTYSLCLCADLEVQNLSPQGVRQHMLPLKSCAASKYSSKEQPMQPML